MMSALASVCRFLFFFFKQKTAYEISTRDWSSDVCSSDLVSRLGHTLNRLHSPDWVLPRSEEHTSELQSRVDISYAVFCLKKKKTKIMTWEHERRFLRSCAVNGLLLG